MKLVYLPGILETKNHFRRLRKELEALGYEVRISLSVHPRLRESDVVISHSGGLLLLSQEVLQRHTVIAVAPSYAPEATVTHWCLLIMKKTLGELRSYNWKESVFLLVWNGRSVFHIRRNFSIFRRRNHHMPERKNAHYLLPQNDPLRDVSFPYAGQIVGIHHDDLYIFPKKYALVIHKILQDKHK